MNQNTTTQEALREKQEGDAYVDELVEKLQELSCSDTERRVYPSFVVTYEDEDGNIDETGLCLYADNDKSEVLLDRRMVPIPSQGRAWMNAESQNLREHVTADIVSDPLLSPSLVVYTPALLMMMTGAPPKNVLAAFKNMQQKILDELDILDKRDDPEAAVLRNFGQQRLGKIEADILAESLRLHTLQSTTRLWPKCITAEQAAIEYHVLIRTLIENNGFYSKHTMDGMEVRTVIEDSNGRMTEELNGLLRDKTLRKVVGPYISQLNETLHLRSIDDPELYKGEQPFGPDLLAEVQHCMVDYTVNVLRTLERWILRVTAPVGIVKKIGREQYETRVMSYFFTEYRLYPHQPRPDEDGCPLQGTLLRKIEGSIRSATNARLSSIPGVWDASPRFLAPAIEMDNRIREEQNSEEASDDSPHGGRKIRRVRRKNLSASFRALHLPMPSMGFEDTARHLYAIANYLVQNTGAAGLNASMARSFWGNVFLPFKTARVPYQRTPGEILPEILSGPLGSWVSLRDKSKGVAEHCMPKFRQISRLYFATKIASSETASTAEKLAHFVEHVKYKTGKNDFYPSDDLVALCNSGDREKFDIAMAAFSLAMGI